jgi:hypothetical protein
MRILLARASFTPSSPQKATTFIKQVVRQAPLDGHDLRELVASTTDADSDLERFRTKTRRRLDDEMLGFDPQVVHVHGIGLLGHLTLETGAPYLISAFAEEFSTLPGSPALAGLIQQAVENAGRVVVDCPEARDRVAAVFGRLESIVVAAELGSPDGCADSFNWLWSLYERIAAKRRGLP